MKVKIISDSTCDLSPELIERYDIAITPLSVHCGDQVAYREDVGRHNAADKCIAYGLRQGWDMSRCILGSTGRISLEMLVKAAVAGIPVFFSRKYPSDIVADWAERLGIALVIRAHSDAPGVYGARERVV